MAFAQGIAGLAAILLARLYPPSAFGQLAAYAGWVTAVGAVATLRLDIEVLRAGSDEAASAVERRGVNYALLAGFLGALISWRISFSAHGWWLPWCVLVGTVLAGVIPLAQARLIRRNALGQVARARVRQSLTQVLVQSGAVPLRNGTGLIVGDLAGRLLMLISLRRHKLGAEADVGEIAAPAVAVGRTSMLAVATLLAGFTLSLPMIAVPLAAGDALGGQFSIALRSVGLPLALIGHPLGQVLVARTIQGDRNAAANLGTRNIVLVLGACGVLIAILAVLMGPRVLPLILGQQWAEAGRMVAPLGIAAGAQLLAVPLSQLLPLRGRYALVLKWELVRTLATVVVTALLLLETLDPLTYCYALAGVWGIAYGVLAAIPLAEHRRIRG
jgi:O-antigen/teichoic acid export membrane protein